MISAIQGLDPGTYQPSRLHSDECIWPEKNCYVDYWIEVIHALGLDPVPVMAFVLAGDYEDDQWTFFKPGAEDIFDLYGIEVQELNVWRTLLDHVADHLRAGKLVTTEADAFWLPDVAGTDYRRNHSKTTIVINSLDLDNQTIDYFHNRSYHRLSGEDFQGLFPGGTQVGQPGLPLYAEFIRHDRVCRRPAEEMAERSWLLLQRYLARAAHRNPVRRLGDGLAQALPALQQQGLDTYHLWAFSNIRQLGASMELAAELLRWLNGKCQSDLMEIEAQFAGISRDCKTLILKGARAVATRRPAEFDSLFQAMGDAWESGMRQLRAAQGPGGRGAAA